MSREPVSQDIHTPRAVSRVSVLVCLFSRGATVRRGYCVPSVWLLRASLRLCGFGVHMRTMYFDDV